MGFDHDNVASRDVTCTHCNALLFPDKATGIRGSNKGCGLCGFAAATRKNGDVVLPKVWSRMRRSTWL